MGKEISIMIEYHSTGRILGIIKVKKEDFIKEFTQAARRLCRWS
jgi:hypothetical protein